MNEVTIAALRREVEHHQAYLARYARDIDEFEQKLQRSRADAADSAAAIAALEEDIAKAEASV